MRGPIIDDRLKAESNKPLTVAFSTFRSIRYLNPPTYRSDHEIPRRTCAGTICQKLVARVKEKKVTPVIIKPPTTEEVYPILGLSVYIKTNCVAPLVA